MRATHLLAHQIEMMYGGFIISRHILFQTPEHAVKGVRVNCVCPWLVDTPLAASDALKESSFPDAMDQHYEETKSTLIK